VVEPRKPASALVTCFNDCFSSSIHDGHVFGVSSASYLSTTPSTILVPIHLIIQNLISYSHHIPRLLFPWVPPYSAHAHVTYRLIRMCTMSQ
jgi:hypothetical protein